MNSPKNNSKKNNYFLYLSFKKDKRKNNLFTKLD